jgi:hypothetical protein
VGISELRKAGREVAKVEVLRRVHARGRARRLRRAVPNGSAGSGGAHFTTMSFDRILQVRAIDLLVNCNQPPWHREPRCRGGRKETKVRRKERENEERE